MKKISVNTMISNLNKWKNICDLMNNDEEIRIIDEIIKNIKSNDSKIKEKTIVSAKLNNDGKLKLILKEIETSCEAVVKENKFILISNERSILDEWGRLSEAKKNKISKLELNVIYWMLYDGEKIRYINKTKKDIIYSIDYFVNNNKRNNALDKNKLI